MDKKRVLILIILIPVIFSGIKIGQFVYKYQEEKFNENIQNQLKIMYDKDFVVKEESSTEGVRWTVGLSKWKKTSYICYRKDIPEIEFEVDLDKTGKTVEADNYQRKRIEYEAFQYYKPFFDAISDKYYIVSDIMFLEKNASSNQSNLLQEVDMPLYLEIHKKTFKEIIENYSDYLLVGFAGRIYSNKEKQQIEETVENLIKVIGSTQIGLSLGIYSDEEYEGHLKEKNKGWDLNKNTKGLRASIRITEYYNEKNEKEIIQNFKEAWKWQ